MDKDTLPTSANLDHTPTKPKAESQAKKEFIPPKEAAAYLGLSLSTLYRLIRAGELQVYRLTPDAPRLKASELESFALGRIEAA